MGRLYRPYIPMSLRCAVAERQAIKLSPPVSFAEVPAKPLWKRLDALLSILAKRIGCDVDDMRLDHDPALGARPQYRRGLSRKIFYTPRANDPDHLLWRPHGAQYEGSHDVKTRIRGDHGQFSDTALMKRERRRAKKKARTSTSRKPRKRVTGRGFPKRPLRVNWIADSADRFRPAPSGTRLSTSGAKRTSDSRVNPRPPKRKWPKRKFEKRGCR